jgi:hypothetical protein
MEEKGVGIAFFFFERKKDIIGARFFDCKMISRSRYNQLVKAEKKKKKTAKHVCCITMCAQQGCQAPLF